MSAPVSVVIVTLNPKRWLEKSLESVADQAAELVVVDNSSEGTDCAEICAKHGARHIRLAANVGFARGVNIGVAAATQPHVALLNDDAFADPGWLEGAVSTLRDDTIAAVVPKLLFAWKRGVVVLEDPVTFRGVRPVPYGRHVTSVTVGDEDVLGKVAAYGAHHEGAPFWTTGATAIVVPLVNDNADVRVNGEPVELAGTFAMVNNAGSFLHPGGWCGDVGFGHRDDGTFDIPADRFAACGAAMVVRTDTWKRIGGLAESFFAYYEDTDWSWRAQLAELRIRYEPSAVVRHVHAQTGLEGSVWFQFFVARNRLLCFTRNAPSRTVTRMLSQRPPMPPGAWKSTLGHLPAELLQRAQLKRNVWRRTPESVWNEWAGLSVPQ